MPEETIRGLYIDDEKLWLGMISTNLDQHGIKLECEQNPDSALERIKKSDGISFVLLDILFRQGEENENKGKPTLGKIKKAFPHLPVIMITTTMLDVEYRDEDYSAAAYKYSKEALKSGEPQAYEQLASIIKKVVREGKVDFLDQDFGFHIGKTEILRLACQRVLEIAPLTTPVLIIGETGTGKELLAQAIHKFSGRPVDNFFPKNMAEIPTSEGGLAQQDFLFGHEPGFFQNRRNDPGRAGIFEECNGGTVFLDEITRTLPEVQVQLHRVLQENRVMRLGSNRDVQVNFRLISATNEPIEGLIESGSFRDDLYYRINTHQIQLPPLRHRKEDIPSLYGWFVKELSTLQRKNVLPNLREDTFALLVKYDWPGNIRELRNKIADAMSRSKSSILQPRDFTFNTKTTENSRSSEIIIDEWVEKVWRGEKNWEHIRQEFGVAGESRRTIIQKLLQRLAEDPDSVGAIGVHLARKLRVKRLNLSQILHELNPPILIGDFKKKSKKTKS